MVIDAGLDHEQGGEDARDQHARDPGEHAVDDPRGIRQGSVRERHLRRRTECKATGTRHAHGAAAGNGVRGSGL